MDNKALYKLAYDVFLLGAKAGDKKNACITNTCIQVAGNPTRVAIAVINTNYTCDLIKEGGVFAVSILDKKVPFETLKHFGMQSGRDVDKLDGLPLPEDVNGVPYINWNCCAVLSCKVVDSMDLTGRPHLAVEALPGQFDQRASAARECVRLVDPTADVEILSSRLYIFDSGVSEKDMERIAHYLINAVESRRKNLDILALPERAHARPVEVLEGFRGITAEAAGAYCR